jgi:LPXTG-motif cell wall-anchored protein
MTTPPDTTPVTVEPTTTLPEGTVICTAIGVPTSDCTIVYGDDAHYTFAGTAVTPTTTPLVVATVQARTLPATGRDVSPIVTSAGALLIVGAVLLNVKHRFTHRP